MKPPSDYRRIRRAQKKAARRREEFKRVQEFMRKCAEQLQTEDKQDEYHV